ncbi:alcohol dehydrogenase catalytic domain-containing protein [Phenylobacterium sp. LjRoot225]|uniref:alcohol dehydrogenase catalytic domain-containing protein n=1 Tax=Phenylobacterium sp. LjRoot225 TaxID=3342285 RepID=UPI003ECCC442
MRAAVLCQLHTTPKVEEIDLQEPMHGEVLVRIAASGICGSDVHVIHGVAPIGDSLPIILGHEGAGVVEAVGPGVTDLRRGDRVIITMGAPCGHCDYCSRGRMPFCNGNPPKATYGEMDDGTYRLSKGGQPVYSFVGIGSLGEYAVVRRRKLVKVELDAPFESLCLTSCGVTTGLGAVFNCAEVTPGASVLVFGCGGVGLCIIQGAKIAGAAKIIAVDNNPAKLDLAANFGASHCILSPQDPKELEAEIRKIAPRGVDYAFDAVGARPERLPSLMAMTDLGGLTVAVGVLGFADKVSVSAADLLYGARRLTGVRGGNGFPGLDIPRILDLYQTGRLKLDELIGATYELDDIAAAFDDAEKANHGRVVVRVTPSLL